MDKNNDCNANIRPKADTVWPLNMVNWYKHHPDVSTKMSRSRNYLGFSNGKKIGFKSLLFKGQPDIRTIFLGPDSVCILT